LGFKERGMMALLLSHNDTWNPEVENLVKSGTDGRTVVYNTINKLIKLGYIKKVAARDSKGRVIKIKYKVFETPVSTGSDQLSDNQLSTSGKPEEAKAKRDTVYKEVTNKEIKETTFPKPSPSFSSSKVKELMLKVPEKFRDDNAIVDRVIKAGNDGFDEHYVAKCLDYTTAKSQCKDATCYCGYFGKTVDYDYASGYKKPVSNAEMDSVREAKSGSARAEEDALGRERVEMLDSLEPDEIVRLDKFVEESCDMSDIETKRWKAGKRRMARLNHVDDFMAIRF